jgi:peptidoglycan/xylan/chitin deacetylase (PgdA/CDA1 family)
MPYPVAACRPKGYPVQEINLPRYLVSGTTTLFEDFETAGDWTTYSGAGTCAADTTNVKTGAQSLAITPATGTVYAVQKTISAVVTPHCEAWAFISDVAKVSLIEVFFSARADYNTYVKYQFAANQLVTGWNHLILKGAVEDIGGGASWSSTMIRLMLRVTAVAGQDVTVSFDNLRSGLVTSPAILLTFDDGYTAEYVSAYAYTKTWGRGTIYVVSDNIGTGGTNLTLAQCQEIYAGGWDIANHTDAHVDLSDSTQGQCETALDDCRDWLIANAMPRAALHVAYPWGRRNATSDAAMTAQGMLTGRLADRINAQRGFQFYPYAIPENQPLFQIPLYDCYPPRSLATVEAHVDQAISYGSVLCLLFHAIGEAGQWSVADFQALVDYISAHNVPLITISDLYSLLSSSVNIPIGTAT